MPGLLVGLFSLAAIGRSPRPSLAPMVSENPGEATRGRIGQQRLETASGAADRAYWTACCR
jgi:hypothetical protein